MAQLRRDYEKFRERGVEIIVVGPEGRESFARYFNDHRLPFIGLPDPQHSVLKLYGQEVSLFKMGRMPAQVLVDREGLARFVHYGNLMSDIPGTDEVLSLIDELEPA
jgi:peroxiredoxin Q/BCP